ncbi:MAG: hypothetical protein ACKO24_13435 [Leptolyngbyaceae cyanobacterium]
MRTAFDPPCRVMAMVFCAPLTELRRRYLYQRSQGQLLEGTVTLLMVSPQPGQPSFAMMTNGDDLVFVKLTRSTGREYNRSRAFAALTSNQKLYRILQILKQISQVVARA